MILQSVFIAVPFKIFNEFVNVYKYVCYINILSAPIGSKSTLVVKKRPFFFLFIAFGGFDPLGLRNLVAKTI